MHDPYVRFIHAFLASYRYFNGVEAEVRQRLQFRPHIRAAARANVARAPCIRARPSAALVGVHVRRTDRLRLSVVPSTTYFGNAMAHLRARHSARGVCFVIESDDVNWCHQQGVFRAADVHIDNETRPAVSLAVLGRCQHHILSVHVWLVGRLVGAGQAGLDDRLLCAGGHWTARRRPLREWVKKRHEQAGTVAPALLPRGVLQTTSHPNGCHSMTEQEASGTLSTRGGAAAPTRTRRSSAMSSARCLAGARVSQRPSTAPTTLSGTASVASCATSTR